MPKNILQDVIPPEKRSIRNIPVPSRSPRGGARKKAAPAVEREEAPIRETAPVEPPLPPTPPKVETYSEYRNGGRKPSKKVMWFSIGLAVVIVLIALSSFFQSALVKIVPRQESVSLAGETLSASKDGAGGAMPFEIMRVTKQTGEVVPATGEEEVERKASGQIVIYNDFDTNSQRLIRNTRFETPEGLIYRIDESVVVPGQRTVNGEVVPGSVEVTVYADEPGEKYNIPLADFTIPGFEGDPRFDDMYARSKTPMTGGFVGVMKTVSEQDMAGARARIAEKLEPELVADLESQLPDNFVAWEGGYFFSYSDMPQSGGGGDSVQVNQEGVLYAIVFNKNLLGSYIAGRFAPNFPNGQVEILDLEAVPFAITEKDKFSPETGVNFDFTMNGNVTLVASFDESAVKQDLVGKPRKDIHTILANYTGIEEAQAVVRPFWKRTFPGNPDDIRIERNIGGE